MGVLFFLRRSINETGIRRRVLRLEFLDRFKIGRVSNHLRELSNLIELTELGLFLGGNGATHILKLPPRTRIDNAKVTTGSDPERKRAHA